MSSMGLDGIGGAFSAEIRNTQAQQAEALERIKANPDDVSAVQDAMKYANRASNLISLDSAIMKAVFDAIRGIIQKFP